MSHLNENGTCRLREADGSIAPTASRERHRRLRLDGRSEDNSQLPYMFTNVTTPEGVELVTSNCLSCHPDGREHDD